MRINNIITTKKLINKAANGNITIVSTSYHRLLPVRLLITVFLIFEY